MTENEVNFSDIYGASKRANEHTNYEQTEGVRQCRFHVHGHALHGFEALEEGRNSMARRICDSQFPDMSKKENLS